MIIGDLTNQTHRLVQKVNAIKSNGITGPYQDTINNMERSANSIRELLAQNPATQPLTEIQSLLEQATYVTTKICPSTLSTVWVLFKQLKAVSDISEAIQFVRCLY